MVEKPDPGVDLNGRGRVEVHVDVDPVSASVVRSGRIAGVAPGARRSRATSLPGSVGRVRMPRTPRLAAADVVCGHPITRLSSDR
jgi:hypothetical protein